MKRYILIVVLIVSATITAIAQDLEAEGIKYKLLGDGKLEVVEGTITGESLVIPERIEFKGRELTITQIGEHAFSGAKITSVKLPSTIKVIGERAFINSTVSSINFPFGLYLIGKESFENTKLDSIFLPQTLCIHPTLNTGVEKFAFRGCKNLRIVEFDEAGYPSDGNNIIPLPKGMNNKQPIRVYAGAFDDCDNIETVIYNGAPPTFNSYYINGHKSVTFPKIVLEFATLYCPIQHIGSDCSYRAMDGFATIKPTPESIPIYEYSKKVKAQKETISKELTKAIKSGSLGYTQGIFICGIKPFFPAKGDPKVDNISEKDGSTEIEFDKKKGTSLLTRFTYCVNDFKKIDNGNSGSTTISAINNEENDVTIFKCKIKQDKVYFDRIQTVHSTQFCLWYNNQIYRIADNSYEYLSKLFDDITNTEKMELQKILSPSGTQSKLGVQTKSQSSPIVHAVVNGSTTGGSNAPNVIPSQKQNFENGFPTPKYIYTTLLNPSTRDQDKFFKSLKANGFTYVELMEYSKKSIGTISFTPGSSQDAVFIFITNKTVRDKFTQDATKYFKTKRNCSFETSEESFTISYDY